MDKRAIGIASALACVAAASAWLVLDLLETRVSSTGAAAQPRAELPATEVDLVPPPALAVGPSERRELPAATLTESRLAVAGAPSQLNRLHGRVYLPDGSFAAGARVHAFRATAHGSIGTFADVVASARQDGTFELELAPGSVLLRAVSEGFCPSEDARLELGWSAAHAPIDLVLRVGGSIHVSVIGLDGAPASERTVRIAGAWIEGPTVRTTDARGELQLGHLPPGEWTLRTWPDDAELSAFHLVGSFERRFEHEDARRVALAEGERLSVVLGARAPDTISVSGRLLQGGAGIAGHLAWQPASADPSLRPRSVETDAEGRYWVELDGPAAWLVSARRSQTQEVVLSIGPGVRAVERRAGAASWIPVEIVGAGSQHVDVVLPAGRMIGQVIDALTARPVPTHVRVQLDTQATGVRSAGSEQWTDREGRFEFVDLAPGTWSLEVLGRSWSGSDLEGAGFPASSRIEGIEIADGAAPVQVAVELPRGQRLAGRVVDPQGEPVQYARLIAWDARGRALWAGPEAMAMPDGSFWLPGLTPGEYTVMAVLRELVSAPLTVRVESGGSSPTSLVLALQLGSYLELDLTTSQAPRVQLGRAHDSEGRDMTCLVVRDERTYSNLTSRLRIGPLPAGAYELELEGLAPQPRILRAQLGPGELHRLDPERDL